MRKVNSASKRVLDTLTEGLSRVGDHAKSVGAASCRDRKGNQSNGKARQEIGGYRKLRPRPSAKAPGILESAAYPGYVSISKMPSNAGSRPAVQFSSEVPQ